jgi:hypothetical protein
MLGFMSWAIGLGVGVFTGYYIGRFYGYVEGCRDMDELFSGLREDRYSEEIE